MNHPFKEDIKGGLNLTTRLIEIRTSTILEQELRRVVVTNNGIFKSVVFLFYFKMHNAQYNSQNRK